METRDLQQKSYDFITNNLQATFNQVPPELRLFWIVDDPYEYLKSEQEDKPAYSVFIYALLEYKKRKGFKKVEIAISQLHDYFVTFQMLLSFAEIDEKTDISIKPIKIFDFDNYMNLKAEFHPKDI